MWLLIQNTLGYRQNRVLCSSHEPLDGIVEEHFPIEAATSLTAFFADGNDEQNDVEYSCTDREQRASARSRAIIRHSYD